MRLSPTPTHAGRRRQPRLHLERDDPARGSRSAQDWAQFPTVTSPRRTGRSPPVNSPGSTSSSATPRRRGTYRAARSPCPAGAAGTTTQNSASPPSPVTHDRPRRRRGFVGAHRLADAPRPTASAPTWSRTDATAARASLAPHERDGSIHASTMTPTASSTTGVRAGRPATSRWACRPARPSTRRVQNALWPAAATELHRRPRRRRHRARRRRQTPPTRACHRSAPSPATRHDQSRGAPRPTTPASPATPCTAGPTPPAGAGYTAVPRGGRRPCAGDDLDRHRSHQRHHVSLRRPGLRRGDQRRPALQRRRTPRRSPRRRSRSARPPTTVTGASPGRSPASSPRPPRRRPRRARSSSCSRSTAVRLDAGEHAHPGGRHVDVHRQHRRADAQDHVSARSTRATQRTPRRPATP